MCIRDRPRSVETSNGEYDRIDRTVDGERDPGVDVAANRDDLEIGPEMIKLGLPTGASGAYSRVTGQIVERHADKRVCRVGARRVEADQPGGTRDGEVLGGVDGQICPSVED